MLSSESWHSNCSLAAVRVRHKSRAQFEEDDMTTGTKRVEGAAEVLGGKIRGGFGKLIGDKQMQAAGKAHVIEGKAKQQLANAVARVKGKK